MKSKQQTAVEWLLENMPEDYLNSIPYELEEQAIKMEREQIINAHDGFPIEFRNCQNGIEYYEQIYGNEHHIHPTAGSSSTSQERA